MRAFFVRLVASLFRASMGVLLAPLLLLLLAGGLLTTEAGLQGSLQFLEQASGGQVRVLGARGRWLGPLQIDRLEIAGGTDLLSSASTRPSTAIVIERLDLMWQPLALLEGQLALSRLHLGRLRLPQGDDEPLQLPDDLRLPLGLRLRLDQLEVDVVEKVGLADEGPLLRELKATLVSNGPHHELTTATARWENARIQARARLATRPPFRLDAQLTASLPALESGAAHFPASTLQAHLEGELRDLQLSANLKSPENPSLGLSGQARLHPFEPQMLARLKLTTSKFNPRIFSPQAPEALLTAHFDLESGAAVSSAGQEKAGMALAHATLAGTLHLLNERPLPVDRQGLPVEKLSARLALYWNTFPRRLKLEALELRSGSGQVNGTVNLHWPDEQHTLPQGQAHLVLKQLDPSRWHTALRPARLNGPLTLATQLGESRAQLDLNDGPLRLEGVLHYASEKVRIERLLLAQGMARLEAEGSLSLEAGRLWQIRGRLAHFNPSDFARLPLADLNAEFDADGRLVPDLTGKLNLSFAPSQLSGEALGGGTTLHFFGMDHPEALLEANGRAHLEGQIDLKLGSSSLALRGGWGRPEDALQIYFNVPDLARHQPLMQRARQLWQMPETLDVAGSLRVEADLAGFPKQPRLRISTQVRGLSLPSRFRIASLDVEGQLGSRELNLKLRGRDLSVPIKKNPGTGGASRAATENIARLDLDVEGTRAQHRLQLLASRAQAQLSLEMTGGFHEAADWRDTGWRGLLSQLRIETGPQWAALGHPALQQAAGLRIDRHEIELKAARFNLAGGQLNFLKTRWTPGEWVTQGQFSDLRWQAENGRGAGEGLRAAGQWNLRQTPGGRLEGQVDAHLPELNGLAGWMDASYTSAGAVEVHLDVGGTPVQPLLHGVVRGQNLAFGIPAYGLQLEKGALALRLEGERVRLEGLNFEAAHHPSERALSATGFNRPERPGRLELKGEILPWQQEAQIDFRLTQLPALQRRERWLLISGEGSLAQRQDALRLKANLLADAGFISGLDGEQPRLPEDVLILGREKPPSSTRLETEVSLDLGERFHLRASGLKARLAGKINLRGQPLQATGSIAAREASFEAYGQQLAVERGIVNFQGPLDDPGLNVLAVRQGGVVEAGVQISGTVRHPIVKLVSTPNVPDTEKLSWIVLGRAPDSGGTDTGVLLAAAGSLLGGDQESITTQLAHGLGFDEISVHGATPGASSASSGTPSSASGNGLENQVITVGKRLSSRVYLSYDQGLSAARGALKLSYALGRRMSIVTRAGDESAVDVFYNFSFD